MRINNVRNTAALVAREILERGNLQNAPCFLARGSSFQKETSRTIGVEPLLLVSGIGGFSLFSTSPQRRPLTYRIVGKTFRNSKLSLLTFSAEKNRTHFENTPQKTPRCTAAAVIPEIKHFRPFARASCGKTPSNLSKTATPLRRNTKTTQPRPRLAMFLATFAKRPRTFSPFTTVSSGSSEFRTYWAVSGRSLLSLVPC